MSNYWVAIVLGVVGGTLISLATKSDFGSLILAIIGVIMIGIGGIIVGKGSGELIL